MAIKVTFLIRRDTAANWTTVNPVLRTGEPAIETDTRRIKYGNGIDNWNDLDYASVPMPAGGSMGQILQKFSNNDFEFTWSSLTAGIVAFTPTGTISATNVQAAIAELGAEKVQGPGASTDQSIVRWDGTGGFQVKSSGVILDDSDNITGVATLEVDDDAYGAGWNGSLKVPTKNALWDKIESMGGSGLPTGGTAGQIIVKVNSTDFNVAWSNLTAGIVTFTPTGGIAATDVQGAIAELDAEKVGGPGASTDNAIARWNGTAGFLVQSSGVIIDDSDNVTIPGSLNLGRAAVFASSIGSGDASLELGEGRSADGNTYIDFHSRSGTDYDMRVIKFAGDGEARWENVGNSNLSFENSGSGSIYFNSAGSQRMGISTTEINLNLPLFLGGATFVDWDGTYVRLSDRESSARIHLGDSGDPGNYYDNTTHYFRSRDGSTTFISFSGTLFTSNVPISVPGDAYGGGWNGSTQVPTKDAIYDKISAMDTTISGKLTGSAITNANALIPTINSPWINYGGGFGGARYFKDAAGVVHIEGLIQAPGGSSTSGVTLFTLLAGYRPADTMMFCTWNGGGAGRIDVDSSGNVIMQSGNTAFTSLSGISFIPA